MKTNIPQSRSRGKFSFSRLQEKAKWKEALGVGRKKDRCVGSGSVKDLEKKNAKENWDVLEVNSFKYIS